MTAPSIDTGHGSSADADTYRATAQPVVAMSLADHMDRSGRWFSLSDDQPVFVRTVDEDAMKLGDGWVIAPAWRLTEPPARTVHRNVGWFAAFARRHGQHAQADWLDDFVRYGGFNASQQAAVSPAEQVGILRQQNEPNPIVPDLLEALRPFALLADMVGEAWTDETAAFVGADGVRITIGQLRKARAALSRAETPTCGGDK